MKKPLLRLFYFNYLLYLRSVFVNEMNQDSFTMNDGGSLILRMAVIDGNLKSEKDIRLEGTIRGDVHCRGQIILTEEAVIDGDVDCEELYTEGLITGNVCVGCKTVMGEKSVICGGLITQRLEIIQGAEIRNGLKLKKAVKKEIN